ncbi:2-succinylbenzoate--CoA ligase [Baekduia alba]|uniref:class I adenylate-forming enzyme family protein n=1 Tax=Baekduia alba TaxID=2997333 RepID=UPI002342355C|nr:AMP-binding protein [Baekduia alba]WCB93877.1 2-succinylbenzoate--CoA ligase [Baekduia alba]
MVVESWLTRAARERPDRRAVNDVSYAELHERARALAAGLPRGARVGLALPPGEDYAVALHGCLLAGALVVPLDLRLTAAERPAVDVLLADAEPPAPAADADVRDAHDLDAPAILVHTSGTTSAPKPIRLTYGNWLWSALGSAVALGLDRDERWLCTLPLSHVGGLSILLRSAIYGTTAIVHERFATERVLDALRDPAGPTVVSLVPTTLARLLDAGLTDPPALRWALLGGAPLPPALLARAADAGVRVAPTYGLTEACSQVATAGVPLFCTRVALDPADGEILVSGPTVSPDAQVDEGGWLRTGDLGALDGDDGTLRIVGRRADTIVTGGENVAPAEVEAALEAHPDVAEAGVLSRPDDVWGEAVVALVRLRDGATATPLDLLVHCQAHLARFKVPKDIMVVVDPLPRTPSGKLVRRELAAQ